MWQNCGCGWSNGVWIRIQRAKIYKDKDTMVVSWDQTTFFAVIIIMMSPSPNPFVEWWTEKEAGGFLIGFISGLNHVLVSTMYTKCYLIGPHSSLGICLKIELISNIDKINVYFIQKINNTFVITRPDVFTRAGLYRSLFTHPLIILPIIAHN